VVLQHPDLSAIAGLPNRHHPLNRLPAGQELRLADDRRAAAALLPALPAALLLRFQTGGPLDGLHAISLVLLVLFLPRFTDFDDRALRVVLPRGLGAGGIAFVATATPASP